MQVNASMRKKFQHPDVSGVRFLYFYIGFFFGKILLNRLVSSKVDYLSMFHSDRKVIQCSEASFNTILIQKEAVRFN